MGDTIRPLTWEHQWWRDNMAFSKAFTLSLILGLALSRPNLQLMEDLEASGMMEESSGLEPRLDVMEEEGSGLQPRLDIIEMNGSGMQDFKALDEEDLGSADFRMAELFQASGDDDETMLVVKTFEEELGSGDLRSVEIGSGMKDEEMDSAENDLIRNLEREEVEANTEAVMASVEEREPKKKARLLAKLLSGVGSVVEEIVTRKQNLVGEALKVKLNLSKGIIDAKK